MEKMTMAKALNEGLRKSMEADPKVVIMGEDVGKLGGVFRITDGLQKDFGEDRVIDTPLAESGIIGTAVGMALRGYRPVCEIQFDGFVFPGFDQIVSQVAKFHNRSAGLVRMPITIRIPSGGGIGAVEHHSESVETYFAHTAGLKVVACSNPSDAYWMIQEAVADDDPIIFIEPKRLYHAAKADVADEPTPLYRSRVVRPGSQVTLAGYGGTVPTIARGGPGGRGGRPRSRGHRPAHRVAARRRHRGPVGTTDGPADRRARGAAQLRRRCRARRPRDRAGVLLPRGARPARHRIRHPLPAEPPRARPIAPRWPCSGRALRRPLNRRQRIALVCRPR